MRKPWLHQFAILLAFCVFLLIGAGALLTSEIRPLPGTPASSSPAPPPGAAQLQEIHRILAYVVGVLAIGFAVLSPVGTRIPAWTAVALIAIDAAEGLAGGPGMLPSLRGVPHALLAPVLFAVVVELAVFTSKSWNAPPIPAENAWEPMKKLAIAVPVLLILQILLGAAFRHDSLGVMWHIFNAMIVLLLVLVLSIFTLRQYPEHPALRPAALTLVIVTGVQVLLGFAVYLILLMASENNMALIIAGVVHVLTGSLTLAASLVLSLQLRRSLIPAPALQTGK